VEEIDPPIKAVRWQNNREVLFGVVPPSPPPGPGQPPVLFPAPQQVDGFLIGAVDGDSPQSPGRAFCPPPEAVPPTGPLPPGLSCQFIPEHDDALDPRIGEFKRRAIVDGFWIVPAADPPKRSPFRVAVRDVAPTPEDLHPQVVGGRELPVTQPFAEVTDLVYAVRIGRAEIPLTSTARVRWAEHLGLVERVSAGVGGTAWVLDRTPPFDVPAPPPGG
jgi:hypothetical protein